MQARILRRSPLWTMGCRRPSEETLTPAPRIVQLKDRRGKWLSPGCCSHWSRLYLQVEVCSRTAENPSVRDEGCG